MSKKILTILVCMLLSFILSSCGTVFGKRVTAIPDLFRTENSFEYDARARTEKGETIKLGKMKMDFTSFSNYAATLLLNNPNYNLVGAFALDQKYNPRITGQTANSYTYEYYTLTYKMPGLDNEVYSDEKRIFLLSSIVNIFREENPENDVTFMSVHQQISFAFGMFQYYEVWALKKKENEPMVWKTVCKEKADNHEVLAQMCINTAKDYYKKNQQSIQFRPLN